MDIAVLLKAFGESQVPWILLSVVLLYLQWDGKRRDEKGLRESINLLLAAFEGFVTRFGTHAERCERMAETLAVIAARKERA